MEINYVLNGRKIKAEISADDMLLDPTCGTGSFLGAFYSILKYHRRKMHSECKMWL